MFLRIASIITPVVLIIFIGWLYGRKAHPDMAGINKATLEVIAPLLVVSSFISKDFVLLDQWGLLLAGVAIVLGSGLIAWPIAKLAGLDPKTFVPPMMFNNCGNMGLPLAVFAFGSLGLARTWFSLPEPVYTSIKLLGDATVPLMLFSLGVRMKDANLSHWKEGFLGAAVCPIAGLLVALVIVNLLDLTELQKGLLFVFAALPPAVLNFLVADRNQQDPELVASIVLLGNLSAMIFVPMGLYLGLR